MRDNEPKQIRIPVKVGDCTPCVVTGTAKEWGEFLTQSGVWDELLKKYRPDKEEAFHAEHS